MFMVAIHCSIDWESYSSVIQIILRKKKFYARISLLCHELERVGFPHGGVPNHHWVSGLGVPRRVSVAALAVEAKSTVYAGRSVRNGVQRSVRLYHLFHHAGPTASREVSPSSKVSLHLEICHGCSHHLLGDWVFPGVDTTSAFQSSLGLLRTERHLFTVTNYSSRLCRS